MNIEAIKKFVDANSYFEFNSDDNNKIMFSTRENGSVYDCEHGVEDIRAARVLAQQLYKNFEGLSISFEVVDEWVFLIVEPKK
jgi:hypothetical protein